ncbi:MAG: glycosyltransferase family 39 protein [Candidatus Nomurabacteria bacterium]|nr:MAG: glycosyltransferase family 39 protein [Candidatus Nomurabacteria bacterium]
MSTFTSVLQDKAARPFWALAALGLVMFFLYTFGLHGTQTYGSPDETANAFFARHYARTGSFVIEESLESLAGGLLHPRSMRAIGDSIVPASWLGLPLFYGLGIRIFGEAALPFFTAAISIFTSFFVFALFRRIWNSQVGWLSSVLWLIHPIFWFYNHRPLWHNTIFVDFLFIAWFFFVRWLGKKRIVDAIGFAVMLGMTLVIRTSELVWVLPAFALYWIVVRQKVPWSHLFLIAVIFVLCFIPIAYYQQLTFGNFLSTGYTITDSATNNGVHLNSLTALWVSLGHLFFPFGIQIRQIAQVVVHYLSSFLGVWTILGLIGLLLVIFRGAKQNREAFAFAWVTLFSLLYLVLLYGSFTFSEFLDPSVLLFGSSYLRYLMPGLLLLVPFMVVALHFLLHRIRFGKKISLFLLFILMLFSLTRIYADPLYGLALDREVQENIASYNKETVLEKVPSNGVLLARDQDKVFWPLRKVIGYNVLQAEHQRAANALVEKVPVYAIVWGEVEAAQLQAYAQQTGRSWRLVSPLEGGLSLYTLER